MYPSCNVFAIAVGVQMVGIPSLDKTPHTMQRWKSFSSYPTEALSIVCAAAVTFLLELPLLLLLQYQRWGEGGGRWKVGATASRVSQWSPRDDLGWWEGSYYP